MGTLFICDYIKDNWDDDNHINQFNKDILNNVTGEFKQLEVINSAVFQYQRRPLMI